MKVLVTGAFGFLGSAVVQSALDAGHDLVALSRPSTDISRFSWLNRVQVVRGDLLEPGEWMNSLRDVEAVVHAAAVVSGTAVQQLEGAVDATRNLLDAFAGATLLRFVHVSSFSVYDFTEVRTGATITEDSPLENNLSERDGYTIAKVRQEELIRVRCEAAGIPYIVLRPGAVFGPTRSWNFGRALRLGPFDLICSPKAEFRLTYVDNCADAIVAALSTLAPSSSIINIVDDDLPEHYTFYRLSRLSGAITGIPVKLPWPVLSAFARIAHILSWVFPGERRLPELIATRRQDARWKPLRYSNDRAHRLLGWTPRVGMLEAIRRTVADDRC